MSYKDQQSTDGSFNTPLYLFNYLDTFFEFKIDPCDSGNNWLNREISFTKNQDGLKQEWTYSTFVNPPYGKISENNWLDKCLHEHRKYRQNIFILLPAKTESVWFSEMMCYSDVIIFPNPRVQFIKNGKVKNGNNIGSVIFGLRARNEKGHDQLRDFIIYNRMQLKVDEIHNGYETHILFPKISILKEYYSTS